MTPTDRPKRIQLSRRKGYRKPEGAIVVSRPSKWGNPFVVHSHTDACYGNDWGGSCPDYSRDTRELSVKAFSHIFRFPLSEDPEYPDADEIRDALRGKDLACWCPLVDAAGNPVPCHADVLLEIANSPAESFGVQPSREGD